MATAKGSRLVAQIDFETTFKTDPAVPSGIALPVNSLEVAAKQSMITPGTITGNRNPVTPTLGNVSVDGGLSVPIDLTAFGYWLKLAMGEPTTTNISTAGTLVGATGVTETIGTWTAVSDGAFKVAIDGSAATAVSSIDFSSGVTTMAHVASKIQAAIRAVATGGFTLATVAWDATDKKFTITSGTTGPLSSVSQLTAPVSGTNISVTGFMKCTAGTLTAGETLYTHVFKVGNSVPSFVLEKGFSDIDQYEKFNGCKIASMKIPFGGDGELVSSFEVMGASQLLSGDSYDDTPTVVVLNRVSNFQAAIEEGGASIGIVTKGEIELSNDLDGSLYCVGSSGIRGDIVEGVAKVSGTLTVLFQSLTLLNKAVNGTESSLKVTWTSGTSSLSFLVPEMLYERTSPGVKTKGGLTIDLKFEGYYNNSADATALKSTLVNATATY